MLCWLICDVPIELTRDVHNTRFIEKFLEGTVMGDPDKFGHTLQEEKADSGYSDWPNQRVCGYEVQNSQYKLYGGAQYDRLLNEFGYAAHSIEFPLPSIHEVASALGTSKSHNLPVFETAVCPELTLIQNSAG
jgi:hypothetical protein